MVNFDNITGFHEFSRFVADYDMQKDDGNMMCVTYQWFMDGALQ